MARADLSEKRCIEYPLYYCNLKISFDLAWTLYFCSFANKLFDTSYMIWFIYVTYLTLFWDEWTHFGLKLL